MPVDPTEFIERLLGPDQPAQPSDNVGQGSTATYCSAFGGTHHMVSHVRGGARVHVERCSLCDWIDFDDLDRQVEGQIGRGAPSPEHVEQPAPVPNDSTPIVDLVMDDMAARKRLGIERYGVALQAGNGRDMLRDAFEEALDLAIYLRGAIAERDA